MSLSFEQYPHKWMHPTWDKIQLRYFKEDCKIRREKNIEDFIITNGIKKIHLIKDNLILENFLKKNNIETVPASHSELVVITSQQFSRLHPGIMIKKLTDLVNNTPIVYFCLNKYYLNSIESVCNKDLDDNYDAAVVQWLKQQIPNTNIVNLTETFIEDGSCFTWVVPSSEILICRK